MKLKTKKYYKNLYEVELENRKKLIQQNSDLSKDNVKYQKEAKLYKEKCARLTVDLEDVDYQLEKTTKERDALKKEKANLKRKLTNIEKELNKDGE